MLPSEAIVSSVTALGIVIAKNKSPEEIALLASMLMQLSDVLSTILANEALIEGCKNAADKN